MLPDGRSRRTRTSHASESPNTTMVEMCNRSRHEMENKAERVSRAEHHINGRTSISTSISKHHRPILDGRLKSGGVKQYRSGTSACSSHSSCTGSVDSMVSLSPSSPGFARLRKRDDLAGNAIKAALDECHVYSFDFHLQLCTPYLCGDSRSPLVIRAERRRHFPQYNQSSRMYDLLHYDMDGWHDSLKNNDEPLAGVLHRSNEQDGSTRMSAVMGGTGSKACVWYPSLGEYTVDDLNWSTKRQRQPDDSVSAHLAKQHRRNGYKNNQFDADSVKSSTLTLYGGNSETTTAAKRSRHHHSAKRTASSSTCWKQSPEPIRHHTGATRWTMRSQVRTRPLPSLK